MTEPAASSPARKRARISQPAPPAPTTPLDADATLLQAADAALRASRVLLRRLSKSPSSSSASSQADHASLLEAQRKHVALAIVCLRAVVARAEDVAMAVRPETELVARCMLVETLVRETTEWDEAELVLSKGHENFREYKWRLLALSVELLVARSSLKLARTTCKRAIADLQATTPTPAAWLYHFQLVALSLLPDPSTTPTALRDLMALATERGDEAVVWALRIIAARLAVTNASITRDPAATEAVAVLATALGLPMELTETAPADVAIPPALGRQLQLQALSIYALYHAQVTGRSALAKSALKLLHKALDAVKPDEAENAGYVRLPLADGDSSITLAMPGRANLYSFVFLLSGALQRDIASSKQPKGLIFIGEGVQRIEDRLKAGLSSSEPTRWLGIGDLAADRAHNQRMLIELLIQRAEAEIMRADSVAAAKTLDEIATRAHAAEVWPTFANRVVLLKGLLAQSTGDLSQAIECYRSVRTLEVSDDGKPGPVHLLATLAYVLARVVEGARPSQRDLSSLPPIDDPRRILETIVTDGHESIDDLVLLALAAVDASNTSLPAVQVIGSILEAVTGSGISKAKYSLSAALNLVTASANAYARCAILALLGNLFVHVQSDQATKMLDNAFALARLMGAAAPGLPSPELVAPGQPPLSSSVVGHAGIGLWCGERLLAVYTRDGDTVKATAQAALNRAHEAALVDAVHV